jgi:hypothetical protein
LACLDLQSPPFTLSVISPGTQRWASRERSWLTTSPAVHWRRTEGAIPIISDVPGFKAYYVIYAPDDTVTAISIFEDYAGAQESNRRGLAWIEQNLAPLLTGPATAMAGPVIVHTLA